VPALEELEAKEGGLWRSRAVSVGQVWSGCVRLRGLYGFAAGRGIDGAGRTVVCDVEEEDASGSGVVVAPWNSS